MQFSQNISLASSNIINNNDNNNSTFSEVIFMQAGNEKTKVETLFLGDHYIFAFLREGSYLEVFYVCVLCVCVFERLYFYFKIDVSSQFVTKE